MWTPGITEADHQRIKSAVSRNLERKPKSKGAKAKKRLIDWDRSADSILKAPTAEQLKQNEFLGVLDRLEKKQAAERSRGFSYTPRRVRLDGSIGE